MDAGTLFNGFNTIMGIGTFLMILCCIAVLIPRISERISRTLISRIIIAIAVSTFVFPLVYQFGFGFPPCLWCWVARIAHWPVLFIFPYAWARREHVTIARYLKPLMIAGALVSLYHYGLQWGVSPESGVCDAVGQSVSCGGIDVLVFGFITIPFMSLVAFITQFLLLRRIGKN